MANENIYCNGEHDPQDHLIHYTKCLEFSERKQYYTSASPDLQNSIDSELRRIQFLRKVIRSDDDDALLVRNVNLSYEEWKKDTVYLQGIEHVRKWRAEHDPPKVNSGSEPRFFGDRHQDNMKYDPEIDFNAYVISYENSQPAKDMNDNRFLGSFPNHKINMVDLLKEGDENPLTVAGKRARAGKEQGESSRPDREQRHDQGTGKSHDTITYFHLPANNMSWVEKAIRRYYDEPDPDYDKVAHDTERSGETRTRGYMLLRPQFWKGQEYGSRSAIVHARHMRPICEMISTDTKSVKLDSTPNNIVLFCPYLHWDTDRYRDRIAQVIGKGEETERLRKQKDKIDALKKRREERQDLPLPNGKLGTDLLSHWPTKQPKVDEDSEFPKPTHTFTSILHPVLAPYPKLKRHFQSKLFCRDPKTGRILADNKLGQLLIDAARLYEVMSCYRDKSLIQRYLHFEPPLHPRRTLDQAYYCTLKSTKWRDRDQVVYRGTRANPSHLHSIDPEKREWDCPGRQDLAEAAATQHAKHGRRSKSADDQLAAELAYKCPECHDHIRKVARLIMVDQLWMWILDEKTLITSFPRRYGVNRKDPSGVHHLVRRHVKNVRHDHIRTVFDLALIVLIEVTNIFFDRAKTPDHQPQVIDIFADAIGEITNKQAVAFDHLWLWTSKIVNLTSPNPFSDITSFVFPLLNINPEGKLQREIKDIIDELDIMLLINRQQLEVIKKFVKHAEDILDPKGEWRDMKGSSFDLVDSDCENGDEATRHLKKKKNYLWFKTQATDLLSDIESHISELQGLRASATSTSDSLDNLLGLMQQQASALQAWQSVRQAEETVKQGRAIIMFTTVTIIFLPLSFMTGIFGMNNSDFSVEGVGNTLSLGQQLQYMLPISLSIIVVAMTLAYAARSKPIVAVFWRYLVSWIVIESGFFNLWLTLTWQRDKWVRKTDRWVKEMKKEVMMKRQKRLELRLIKEQAKLDAEANKKAAADGVCGAGGGAGSAGRRGWGVFNRATAGNTSTRAPIQLKSIPPSPTTPQTAIAEQVVPRASALSGMTTLAPTSTRPGPDPPTSSAATMRGGAGGQRSGFIERWDRDIV